MKGKILAIIGSGLLLFALFQNFSAPEQECEESTIWTRHDGIIGDRLVDYSGVGYFGRPEQKREFQKIDVRDHGAFGDGIRDDTEAIRQAIGAANAWPSDELVHIFFPRGRYVISDVIRIRRANTMLVGEGPGRTQILPRKGLGEMDLPENSTTVSGKKVRHSWSFGGGILSFEVQPEQGTRGRPFALHAPVRRGQTVVQLDRVNGLMPGRLLQLMQFGIDGDTSLILRGLVAESEAESYQLNPRQLAEYQSKPLSLYVSRILSVIPDENKVVFSTPFPLDVKVDGRTEFRFLQSLDRVGMKDLSVIFSPTIYEGHFSEKGQNAVQFDGASRCTMENIRIRNADYGVFLKNSHFCTLKNLIFDAGNRGHSGYIGHHAMTFARSTHNLAHQFQIEGRFVHDLTVTTFASNNVFSQGRGTDMNMDHHRGYPQSNLFTDLHLGRGSRAFYSSGNEIGGPHAASFASFWNIRSFQRDIKLPENAFGAFLNLVFVQHPSQISQTRRDWHIEPSPTKRKLCAPNLYRAMRARAKAAPHQSHAPKPQTD